MTNFITNLKNFTNLHNSKETSTESLSENSDDVISTEAIEIKPKKKFYQSIKFKISAIIIIITIIFNSSYNIVLVSGDSMEPNFHDGNVLLGHKHFDIWRFDVLLMSNDNSKVPIIKRAIGLPNETIEFKDNNLYVNGEYRTDPYAMGNTEDFSITLGPDEFFCMGDNRENSADSRTFGVFTSKDIFAKINYKVYPEKK